MNTSENNSTHHLNPRLSKRLSISSNVESKVFGKYKKSINLSAQDAEFQAAIQKALKVINTDTKKEKFFHVESQRLSQENINQNPENKEEQSEEEKNEQQDAEFSESSSSSDDSDSIVESSENIQQEIPENDQKNNVSQASNSTQHKSQLNSTNAQESID